MSDNRVTASNKNKLIVAGIVSGIVFAAALIWLFVWYANTVIPHTYPTRYVNGWWGFVHGIMIVPTFFWSLFADKVTIYQAPNSGNWYNLGYFIGISIIMGGSHGARSSSSKYKK